MPTEKLLFFEILTEGTKLERKAEPQLIAKMSTTCLMLGINRVILIPISFTIAELTIIHVAIVAIDANIKLIKAIIVASLKNIPKTVSSQ